MNTIELIKKVKRGAGIIIENSHYYLQARSTSEEKKISALRQAIIRFYVDLDIQNGDYDLLTSYIAKADELIRNLKSEKRTNTAYAKLLRQQAKTEAA